MVFISFCTHSQFAQRILEIANFYAKQYFSRVEGDSILHSMELIHPYHLGILPHRLYGLTDSGIHFLYEEEFQKVAEQSTRVLVAWDMKN